MQFRIYDRQTLSYKDGGYVGSYTIDDDYIVNNNSVISIVKALNDKVLVGDIICLIKTSGAYHKGVITTFDNTDLTITYKSEKELFNNNMLNPLRYDFLDVEKSEIVYHRFGIDFVANILNSYFGLAEDTYRQLPIKITTDGDVTEIVCQVDKQTNSQLAVLSFNANTYENIVGEQTTTFTYNNGWKINGVAVDLTNYGITTNGIAENGDIIQCGKSPKMLWKLDNDQINIVDWLVDLFESYNVTVRWKINFDIANENRTPYYEVVVSAITNSGKIIRDNVNEVMQMITYTENELPEATVCTIIDQETKDVVMLCSGNNLLNPQQSTGNKELVYNSGYESKTDSENSDITGYIPVEIKETGTYYTFSFNGYDGLTRRIHAYNKNKTLLESVTYNTGYQESNTRVAFSILYNNKNIKYIKICYDNSSTKLQFEKGEKTVTETVYEPYNQEAIYYLYEKNGNYYVSLNVDEKAVVEENGVSYYMPLRVLPSKMKIVTYNTDSETLTPEQCAQDTLIPSKFNQIVEIQINGDSKMFDFANAQFGDMYKIINKNGTINSNYTGRKETSANNWVTLYFGLGRQNYTDLVQMRFRKNKYQVVYG